MRQLTYAQLEAELQVGTVDISEVELISDAALQQPEALLAAPQGSGNPPYIAVGDKYVRSLMASSASFRLEFEANLARQLNAAFATVIPDHRGAESVAAADQELPYIF